MKKRALVIFYNQILFKARNLTSLDFFHSVLLPFFLKLRKKRPTLSYLPFMKSLILPPL